MSILLYMCRIYYDNVKQSELVRMICFQIEAAFYSSEKSRLKFSHRLGEHEFHESRDIVVEADLEHPPPRLRFADTNVTCYCDVELSSCHIYFLLVYRHLTIDDVTFTHRMTSSDHHLLSPMSLTSQSFALTREHYKRLGSGKPSFVMALPSNVWTLVLSDGFHSVEPISDFGVEHARVEHLGVAIYSHTCEVEMTTSASARVSATNNISMTKFNSVYSNRCPLWHVTTSLLKSTTPYLIETIAWNRAFPEVVADSTTTATPFVYDVFVVLSKRWFVVGRDDQLLLCTRGNKGMDKMSVDVDSHKRSNQTSVITKSTQTSFFTVNFPMGPRDYTTDSMPIKFESYGEKVTAANNIKNQMISTNIKKLKGNIRNWSKTAIDVEHHFHLTDDDFFHCSAVPIRSFIWQMFEVKSKDEIPVFKNRFNFKLDVTKPKICADVRLFAVGLCVAKLFLTVHNQPHFQTTVYHQDSTVFQVDKATADAMIEDGTRSEIGETRYLEKTGTALMLACARRAVECVRNFQSDRFSKAGTEKCSTGFYDQAFHYKK